MADEQPPAKGEEPGAEQTGSGAPEAAAEQAGSEEQVPAASEEAAPAVGDETTGSDDAQAETPGAPEAPAEEAPAPATAAEPDGAGEEPAPAAEPAPADEPAPAPAAAPEGEGDATASAPAEPRRQRPRQEAEQPEQPDVVPGAHLEPDLVLEESRPSEGEYADPYATDDDVPVADGEQAAGVEETPAPAARTPLELAADARYRATGKRKRAVARVILKPGSGTYTINGKELDTYFPRVTLQKNCRLPLETTGNATRMDVVAKIHGGGVSSQAIALRHGISRALVEADPNLRSELKRHGFLTRDARVKERKKAGLKKARKRPQFSKR